MEQKPNPDDEQILQTIATSAAASSCTAISIAISTATNLIIWRDGKVVEVSPEKLINKI
jgi:hypothetical protein